MNRVYNRSYSPILQRNMEMLVFGTQGTPVLVFPTAKGRFFEFEDRGMIASITERIQEGLFQVFCVDSLDAENWYNAALPPRDRILKHLLYERYIAEEVLPYATTSSRGPKVYVAGCSFGGYHAMNFTLKHPKLVDCCISLSGTFDIRPLLDGYFDDDCYYNNPVEYLSNLTDESYLSLYRKKIRFILAAGESDFSLEDNLKLSRIFDTKGIRHWLDVWGDHTKHDWPWWQMMLRKFLD